MLNAILNFIAANTGVALTILCIAAVTLYYTVDRIMEHREIMAGKRCASSCVLEDED